MFVWVCGLTPCCFCYAHRRRWQTHQLLLFIFHVLQSNQPIGFTSIGTQKWRVTWTGETMSEGHHRKLHLRERLSVLVQTYTVYGSNQNPCPPGKLTLVENPQHLFQKFFCCWKWRRYRCKKSKMSTRIQCMVHFSLICMSDIADVKWHTKICKHVKLSDRCSLGCVDRFNRNWMEMFDYVNSVTLQRIAWEERNNVWIWNNGFV